MRRWDRSQKYRARPRHLYALLFADGCYIGQSVNPQARAAQHRRPAGGWCGRRFRLVLLGTVNGSEAEAKDYEHAWRLKAQAHGWQVYALPPGIVCDPRRQATFKHRRISWTLRWPRRHSRQLVWRIVNWFAR
jgi:hypothetical protein